MTLSPLITIEPTAREYQAAYELVRPAPLLASPVEHAASLVAEFREELLRPFDALALELDSISAAKLRCLLLEARGQL